jgi:hypothetical protein
MKTEMKTLKMTVRKTGRSEVVEVRVHSCGAGQVLTGEHRGHTLSKHQLANGGCTLVELEELS